MNLLSLTFLIVIFGCHTVPAQPGPVKDSSVVFAGTTPCSNVIRAIHNIKPEADCQLQDCECIMVEWKLILYMDANTRSPMGYALKGVNRHSVKETNMYSEPGMTSESKGKWAINKGTKTDPNAIVYQLNPDKPAIKVSFLKLGDILLHIIDQDEKLMIGNEFHSYTLNRVSK
jgi:hypothetical protein